MEKVIKRDGREELFNKDKIIKAVEAAFQDIDEGSPEKAHLKAREIANFVSNIDENLTVEQIHGAAARLYVSFSRIGINRSNCRSSGSEFPNRTCVT